VKMKFPFQIGDFDENRPPVRVAGLHARWDGRAMKIGDWIHDSLGVGKIIAFDGEWPMIQSGNGPGWGFTCYHARPATEKEIKAAMQGEYFTDSEEGMGGNETGGGR